MKNSDKYALLILEKYRVLSGLNSSAVYELFEKKGIFDYIEDTYEALHTQDTNLVVKEIAVLIKNRKKI
ncbi:MAG: DUF3791 domain-containing protein [Endomicrobia bacterium]|nr:DUF3791 domain-containing protein [Endomicrobiia bacterium]